MQAHPQSSLAARAFPHALSPVSSSFATPVSSPQGSAPGPSAASTAGRRPLEVPGSLSEGAGLAHDARNLLQALGLYSELLNVPGVLRPEHRHYATELRQLSDRSSALMERLLKGFPSHLAQTDGCLPSAPAAVPEPPCANPGKALRSQAALLDRIAAPWATVAVEVQDALPSLEFGAEILERITVNLVLNAAEALRKSWNAPNPLHSELSGGRIVVSLRMAAGRLRLMVEDNGPGMPPSIAAAFLRPTPLPAGTARGLGHRIVHELATATGGHLSIRVRPGAGTAFCLEWPINPGSLAASSIPRPRAATGPQRVPAALVGQIRQGIHRTANGGREAC